VITSSGNFSRDRIDARGKKGMVRRGRGRLGLNGRKGQHVAERELIGNETEVQQAEGGRKGRMEKTVFWVG